MDAFNIEHFARQLIAETLFYDDEYETTGNLSLIDPTSKKERFLAMYVEEDKAFVIEEAIEWEEGAEETDDIGYSLAVDSKGYGTYATAEEAADVVLMLAREHNLLPSVTLIYEEDDVA